MTPTLYIEKLKLSVKALSRVTQHISMRIKKEREKGRRREEGRKGFAHIKFRLLSMTSHYLPAQPPGSRGTNKPYDEV